LTRSRGGNEGWFASTSPSYPLIRLLQIAVALSCMISSRTGLAADLISELLQRTYWGEGSEELLRSLGKAAMRLPQSLDFGDSYADVVLTGEELGGVPVIVFFQMDKATRGLERIQLERPRRGVNPAAFRAISAALHTAYGKPDKLCVIPVRPISGYQAATEELWVHGRDVVSAIFRDTTLQAFEGCLYGLTAGPCGLTGQLLVRISPIEPSADPNPDPCALAWREDRALAHAVH
jgi:hypothetical protein